MTMNRHPEVRAKRASKDARPGPSPHLKSDYPISDFKCPVGVADLVPLRGHLRVTEKSYTSAGSRLASFVGAGSRKFKIRRALS